MIYVGEEANKFTLRPDGSLRDISPTLINLLKTEPTQRNDRRRPLKAAPQAKSPKDASEAIGIIQPVVVSLGGKHLRLYARSTSQIGKICVADSNDLGATWSDARPLDLPNPNSGIDLVKLHDGRIILIYNDTTSGRSPLNLAVSNDGQSFKNFATLESNPGEFSYPAIIEGSDKSLHITYTFNRKSIRYVNYPINKIPK
jgi:predicted neuraminidase